MRIRARQHDGSPIRLAHAMIDDLRRYQCGEPGLLYRDLAIIDDRRIRLAG
jgi:hypothetical protein